MPARTISVFRDHEDRSEKVHRMFGKMPAVVELSHVGDGSPAWDPDDQGYIVRGSAGVSYLFAITPGRWRVRGVWRVRAADEVDAMLVILHSVDGLAPRSFGARSGAVIGPVSRPPPTRGGRRMTAHDDPLVDVIIETLPLVVRCLDFAAGLFARKRRPRLLTTWSGKPTWLSKATAGRPVVIVAAPAGPDEWIVTVTEFPSGVLKDAFRCGRLVAQQFGKDVGLQFSGTEATGVTQPAPKPPRPPSQWLPRPVLFAALGRQLNALVIRDFR